MNRHPLSAPGKYYIVCNRCLAHGLCEHEAPNNIRLRDDDEGCAYVFKQPENEEEARQCRMAMVFCPMSAVLDDGVNP